VCGTHDHTNHVEDIWLLLDMLAVSSGTLENPVTNCGLAWVPRNRYLRFGRRDEVYGTRGTVSLHTRPSKYECHLFGENAVFLAAHESWQRRKLSINSETASPSPRTCRSFGIWGRAGPSDTSWTPAGLPCIGL